MDNTKDIQKGDFLSKILDHDIKTNPFGENRSGERAYRRAERIAAALYLITNHIDPDDDLRISVRRLGDMLLSQILELRDEMRSGMSSKISSLESTIRHLISLCKMLLVAGFISYQNADAISEALDELGAFINTSQRSMLSESIHLSREDLMDVRNTAVSPIKDIRDKQSIKDKPSVKDNSSSPSAAREISGQISVRGHSILEVLRTGGDLNIRDIAANLPEYSDKMIQRELADLVQRRAVEKKGLKRWSRYSIVK